jgi:glycosyltransferase involved in cell wall biosynthesis
MQSTHPLTKSGQSSAIGTLTEPVLSIVIPTFNRSSVLKRVLAELDRQCGAERAEILVVDDGSADETTNVLVSFAQTTRVAFWFGCLQEHGGPAKVRNTALKMARGRIVVIMGDDTIPAPDFVSRHRKWHEDHPSEADAVLGYVTWPEELNPSPFMKWMEQGGRRYFFNFQDMQSNHEVDSSFFYTSNVSLKRALLFRTSLFDESFPFASQEDLELGYRLGKCGMRLYFDREIVGYHWHNLVVQDIIRRTYLHGYSAKLYWEKVPDTASLFKRTARRILASVATSAPGLFLWKMIAGHLQKSAGGPVSWMSVLMLSYWVGSGDSSRNRPSRIA